MPLRYGAPRSVRALAYPSRLGLMRTRLRRFQAVAFFAALLFTVTGIALSGGFKPDTLSPSRTLQTATLPAATVLTSMPAPPPPSAVAPTPAPVRVAPKPEPHPAPEPAVAPRAEAPAPEATADVTPGTFFAEGTASYYGRELAGRPTASGERFDPNGLTAAHRTLPLGSRIRVTNPRNGQSVVVRVNDRGPFHGNRILDLSHGAARAIGLAVRGTGRVVIDLLERGTGRRGRRAPERAEAPVAPTPAPDTATTPAPTPAPVVMPADEVPAPADSTRR